MITMSHNINAYNTTKSSIFGAWDVWSFIAYYLYGIRGTEI